MTPRAAIISTVRNPGPSFESFLRYHTAIGFEHILLFFDDADDPAVDTARRFRNVTIKRNNSHLRRLWASTRLAVENPYFVSFWRSELMARQSLNAEIAIRWAIQKKIQWLLHIDCDELFYSFGRNVGEHFRFLTQQKLENVVYCNYEAIPESIDIADYFRSVSLFKKNFWLQRGQTLNLRQKSIIRRIPQLPPDLFFFYRNGKSAARVRSGLLPDGSHRFFQKRPTAPFISPDAVILHYPCCGFQNFWSKYKTLGPFADKWFDHVDIAKTMGSFHLESRDVVASGNKRAARSFYRNSVFLSNAAIQAVLESGLACRITEPLEFLSKVTKSRGASRTASR